MGFFGKIKQNISHGGVKVDFQAPASVSMNDPALPVTVNISNTGGEQQTIKSVKAQILASSNNQSFSQPSNFNSSVNNNPQNTVSKPVARADNVEQFVLMPGETKSVQLNIVMNAGAAAASQLPEGSAEAQVAGALQKLQSISEVMNQNSFTYSLQASADVDGIALDPAKEYPLQILKPGEFGGATNIHA